MPIPEWASWRCTAAYFYLLQLDGPSLAWEYLRRNPDYQKAWQRCRLRAEHTKAQHWGLRLFEDPRRDARAASVAWIPDPDSVLRLQAGDDPAADGPRFRLWRVAGRKVLIHDGTRLLLVSFIKGRTVRIAISTTLDEGMPYTYALIPGTLLYRRWRALVEQVAWLQDGSLQGLHGVMRKPDRASMVHMRCLQALDGVLAGASQRQIAEALFGQDEVLRRWHPDGELRAQVRHLIRRARALSEGGYRRLLQFTERRQGDEPPPSESP